MDEIISLRKNKPMFLIDIAVPRDIEPKVNDIDNVYLYDVDDLQGVVQANLKERKKEAEKAEAIINEEIIQFYRWLSTLEVKPTIARSASGWKICVSAKWKRPWRISRTRQRTAKAIEALTRAIINKVLHQPTMVLKVAERLPAKTTSTLFASFST